VSARIRCSMDSRPTIVRTNEKAKAVHAGSTFVDQFSQAD
jgi:hypothetical protein